MTRKSLIHKFLYQRDINSVTYFQEWIISPRSIALFSFVLLYVFLRVCVVAFICISRVLCYVLCPRVV